MAFPIRRASRPYNFVSSAMLRVFAIWKKTEVFITNYVGAEINDSVDRLTLWLYY